MAGRMTVQLNGAQTNVATVETVGDVRLRARGVLTTKPTSSWLGIRSPKMEDKVDARKLAEGIKSGRIPGTERNLAKLKAGITATNVLDFSDLLQEPLDGSADVFAPIREHIDDTTDNAGVTDLFS
jgi:hypothetical protein